MGWSPKHQWCQTLLHGVGHSWRYMHTTRLSCFGFDWSLAYEKVIRQMDASYAQTIQLQFARYIGPFKIVEETWIYQNTPEIKLQSGQCISSSDSTPKRAKQSVCQQVYGGTIKSWCQFLKQDQLGTRYIIKASDSDK